MKNIKYVQTEAEEALTRMVGNFNQFDNDVHKYAVVYDSDITPLMVTTVTDAIELSDCLDTMFTITGYIDSVGDAFKKWCYMLIDTLDTYNVGNVAHQAILDGLANQLENVYNMYKYSGNKDYCDIQVQPIYSYIDMFKVNN